MPTALDHVRFISSQFVPTSPGARPAIPPLPLVPPGSWIFARVQGRLSSVTLCHCPPLTRQHVRERRRRRRRRLVAVSRAFFSFSFRSGPGGGGKTTSCLVDDERGAPAFRRGAWGPGDGYRPFLGTYLGSGGACFSPSFFFPFRL